VIATNRSIQFVIDWNLQFFCFILNFFSSSHFFLQKHSFWSEAGVPDFSWYNIPNDHKIYQMTIKFTKFPQTIQNCGKIDKTAITYMPTSSITRPYKIYPNWDFWKYTIWQPWSEAEERKEIFPVFCTFAFIRCHWKLTNLLNGQKWDWGGCLNFLFELGNRKLNIFLSIFGRIWL
jgi:hypothetical protein